MLCNTRNIRILKQNRKNAKHVRSLLLLLWRRMPYCTFLSRHLRMLVTLIKPCGQHRQTAIPRLPLTPCTLRMTSHPCATQFDCIAPAVCCSLSPQRFSLIIPQTFSFEPPHHRCLNRMNLSSRHKPAVRSSFTAS